MKQIINKTKIRTFVFLSLFIFSLFLVQEVSSNNEDIIILNMQIDKTKEQTLIDISAKDYHSSSERYTRAIVFFKQDITVIIRDIKIICEFNKLNGLYALFPTSFVSEVLSGSWFVEQVINFGEQNIQNESSKYYSSDTLAWGVDDIDAELVWSDNEDDTDIETGNITGDGIKLLLIDSGIDTDHDDLKDNYVGGKDMVDDDTTPEDSLGHGTACAGIIAAADNDWGIIGVAPEIDLYVVKNSAYIAPDYDNVVAGIYWAIDNDMDIISMSLGLGNNNVSELKIACEVAYRSGIVIVAAAGNNAWSYLDNPAGFLRVASVGAVAKYAEGEYHRVADYNENVVSNYDDTISTTDFLDIVAPGGSGDTYTTALNNSHSSNFGGTSSATAHVAAVCGLVLKYAAENNLDLTPGEVRKLIRESANRSCFIDARSITGEGDEYGYSEKYHGFGLINARNAIDYAEDYSSSDTDNDGLTDYQEIVDFTSFTNNDTDSDGMPDGWEYSVFNSTTFLDPTTDDADEDYDGDLISNLNEYLNGSNPLLADTDGDGLSDYEEIVTYSTDPADEDSDNDSCKDGWEIYYGYDPNDYSDGALDLDNDDMRNIDEHFVGTNPNDADTDNDSIIDGDEVFWNLDPLDASDADDDNDDDGLTNLEEINGWYDLNDDEDYEDAGEKSVYQTNPNDSDTDGDGWDDYREQYPLKGLPTDPTDPNDHPPFFP